MIEQQAKLDIFRDGLWCIADMGTEAYQNATLRSEAKISSAAEQKIGRKVVYFYCVIIFCFMIKKDLYRYIDRTVKKTNYRNSLAISIVHRASALVRFISYRRFPTTFCTVFQVPSSLGSSLLISAGFLFILCYLFIPKIWYRDCLGFGGGPLAIRGGHEAIALIPLIYILSGKTNLVTAFTGVSYEKLVVFHRWVSFICCFCAWVHAVPFYLQPIWEGGKERLAWYESTHWTYYSGIPPIVFLTVLVVFSHSAVRRFWYELWLQLHWVCAVGLYISLFYHCNGWTEGSKYMVATGACWVFQVVWRVMSKEAVGFNFNGILRANRCIMRKFPSGGGDGENAFFEMLIENSLDDTRRKHFTWRAGQHCLVRVAGLRMLERHPFSIVSTCRPKDEFQNIKLIIKAKGRWGMTRSLYEQLGVEGGLEEGPPVYVEGPYGGIGRDLGAFTNVFLLSTGTGITGVFPYFMQCCEYMRRSDCVIASVRSDWIVRSGSHVGWVLDELRELKREIVRCRELNACSYSRFKFNVYIKDDDGTTGRVRKIFDGVDMVPGCVDEPEEKNGARESVLGLYDGRQQRLSDILEDVGTELGRGNIIVTCGTASMARAVGAYVADLQCEVFRSGRARGGGTVEEVALHTESFDL